MNLIKQSKSNSCVAAVLAMLINESEEYVLKWFKYDEPPFYDEDVFIFLAHHGIYLSLCIDFNSNGESLKNINTINVEVSIKDRLFYMIVQSKTNPKWSHACILKDGIVYDPLHNTPQKIKNYKVLHLYPLMLSEVRSDLFFKSIGE